MRWDGRMAEHTFSTATAPQRPRKQMPPLWAKTSTSVGAKIEEDVVIHFLQEGPRLRRARTAVGRHGAREQHEKGRTPLHHSKIRTVVMVGGPGGPSSRVWDRVRCVFTREYVCIHMYSV